jgi:hypothetical protein
MFFTSPLDILKVNKPVPLPACSPMPSFKIMDEGLGFQSSEKSPPENPVRQIKI